MKRPEATADSSGLRLGLADRAMASLAARSAVFGVSWSSVVTSHSSTHGLNGWTGEVVTMRAIHPLLIVIRWQFALRIGGRPPYNSADGGLAIRATAR